MASITDRTRKRLSQKQLDQRLRSARRQQAAKARAARRQLDRIHQQLPGPVHTLNCTKKAHLCETQKTAKDELRDPNKMTNSGAPFDVENRVAWKECTHGETVTTG